MFEQKKGEEGPAAFDADIRQQDGDWIVLAIVLHQQPTEQHIVYVNKYK
jgi:hypothetical protein